MHRRLKCEVIFARALKTHTARPRSRHRPYKNIPPDASIRCPFSQRASSEHKNATTPRRCRPGRRPAPMRSGMRSFPKFHGDILSILNNLHLKLYIIMSMGISPMRMQMPMRMNLGFIFKMDFAVFYRANFIRRIQCKVDIVRDDDV